MSRWLFNPVVVLMFSLSFATAAIAIWPFFPGRPVPEALTSDVLSILLMALLFGIGVTVLLILDRRTRQAD